MPSTRVLVALAMIGRAVASDLPSRPDLRPLLTTTVRERLLREASKAIKRDKPGMCGWYSPGGERLLGQMLDYMPSAYTAETAAPKGNPKDAKWTTAHNDALWLLCRTQLGAIEAALIELGDASLRCERLRKRWRHVARNTASERLGALIARQFGNVTLVGGLVHFVFVGRQKRTSVKFGCAHTQLGKGARRRALLRSERSIAAHAGALHDLRVAIRAVGGEWLELGSWLGGPPQPEMDWEIGLDAAAREELLVLCQRATVQMSRTAEKLVAFGAFHMYRVSLHVVDWTDRAGNGNGNGAGAANGAVSAGERPSAHSVPKLLDATRTQLSALAAIRQASRNGPIPRSLRPPAKLRRHWLLALSVGVAVWMGWLRYAPMFTPEWCAEKRALLLIVIGIHNRWWATHVTEPLAAVAKELFHGYEPIVEAERVEAARSSFARMLEQYVLDMYADSPPAKMEAVLGEVRAGELGVLTEAYEKQLQSPLSSLLRGELVRSLLLNLESFKLMMLEEIQAVDKILQRNDFNLQLMATVPAFIVGALLLMGLRQCWLRLRTSSRLPLEEIRCELIGIEAALTRADGTPRQREVRARQQPTDLTRFEASPMDLCEAGEVVFGVHRLRKKGNLWLRGWLRKEMLHDAQELLESGRLSAMQRAQIARALLRRLDNTHAFSTW